MSTAIGRARVLDLPLPAARAARHGAPLGFAQRRGRASRKTPSHPIHLPR
ncbi:hypothetical protein N177_1528 [Lutibaculum baratangense AMV1]|uniref:Uncharacterized protein n=1 Tax=Lutibaculum baratangense AMV1 TaxID=631454 RepID=V4RRC3_9HYPH|nr:hypothetical protein N177_1528 [Lutibaculum baratangense AMV1]